MTNSQKYYEIMEKLRSEGKVQTLNSAEDLKAINELNKRVEETKEQCKSNDAYSQLEAVKTIVK
jgi:hypothetical protein